MELTQHELLDELMLAPPSGGVDNWTTFPNPMNDFSFPNHWNFESFDTQIPDFSASNSSSNSSLLQLISPAAADSNFPYPLSDPYPLLDFATLPPFDSFYPKNDDDHHHTFQDCRGMVEIEQQAFPAMDEVSNMGFDGETKRKGKKLQGQPSKNLMAERRRRKRLNDRLSMLRSIVPKISKMDRTSILADTIDYMKELLNKVNELRGEDDIEEEMNLKGSAFRELKPNEVLVRNLPKFDVERRDQDTRVQISCAAKPGLLLSTVNTLEALGLDIEKCVISCFNDFSLRASCFEADDHRTILGSEDIKQALFRNAGYGGRCL